MPVGSIPYFTRNGLPSRHRRCELLAKFGLGHDLVDSAFENPQLLGHVPHHIPQPSPLTQIAARRVSPDRRF